MTNTQIESARDAGCETEREIAFWNIGYSRGVVDTLDEAIGDIRDVRNIISSDPNDDDIYDSIKEEFKGKDND